MSNRVFQKKNRSQPPSLNTSKNQQSAASRIAIGSAFVATIAALISAWLAFKQFQLQTVQTNMQVEQTELSKEQAKFQTLQTLPVLSVKRKPLDAQLGATKLEVCGATAEFRMISGFKARWLSEFGRYTVPANDPTKIQQIRVPILYKNESEYEEEVIWRPAPGEKGNDCVSAVEPNWLPILKFVKANSNAPNGYSYWHKTEAMVVVHQRDMTGSEHLRHYVFTHESPNEAQLISNTEAKQWISDYESAIKLKHSITISSANTDIRSILGFFR